jgi:hypothetical protein
MLCFDMESFKEMLFEKEKKIEALRQKRNDSENT